MSSIKLTADSGGGTFEIKAPSSSGNTRVLTLPDTGNLTLGKTGILQVVEAVKTDTATTSTTIYGAIAGLQPQITPTSNTSKIMIFINLKWGFSNENNDVNFKLFRSIGGTETEIFAGAANGSNQVGFYGAQDALGKGIHIMMPISSQYLDSPSTTSQITYLIKWQIQRSGSYNYINRPGYDTTGSDYHRTSSSVTLMEVAS